MRVRCLLFFAIALLLRRENKCIYRNGAFIDKALDRGKRLGRLILFGNARKEHPKMGKNNEKGNIYRHWHVIVEKIC